MYGRDNLFETIMSLRHTEIPYRSARNKGNQTKPKKQRKPKPNTLPDSRYKHLVAEGSRLDLTVERRMEIREELTLIRQQKRMMKMEYYV